MESNLVNRINGLDDFQVLRFFDYFGRSVFESIETTTEQLKNGIPNSIQETTGISVINDLSDDVFRAEFDPVDAVAFARTTLLSWARDDALSRIVEEALNNYKDDELGAEIVLAVGFAVSMILMTATTGIKIKFGNVEIEKKVAEPEMVEAVVRPFKSTVTKVSSLKEQKTDSL